MTSYRPQEAQQVAASGWGWPHRANKPHYFEDGRSLCSRWWLLPGAVHDVRDDRWPGDACAKCERALATRAALRRLAGLSA